MSTVYAGAPTISQFDRVASTAATAAALANTSYKLKLGGATACSFQPRNSNLELEALNGRSV